MDISSFDTSRPAEKGVVMVAQHPVTYEDMDIRITLAGTDSSRYRNEIKARAEKQLSRGKKTTKIDIDKAERDGCELLAACTLGWEGIEEHGKPVVFTTEAAIDLYLRHRWLREQVDAFIGDRANFFPRLLKA